MGFTTWWRVKTSGRKKRKRQNAGHESSGRGSTTGFGRTLEDFEVLEVGVFAVNIEFDPGHGHIHYRNEVIALVVLEAKYWRSDRRSPRNLAIEVSLTEYRVKDLA